MTAVGNISPNLENYIEVIHELIGEKGEARVKDVAEKKDVKMASVNSALKKLVVEDLIIHESYGLIKLTHKGKSLAEKLNKRHSIIKRFLKDVLKIKPKIAETDACAIEHLVHKETVQELGKYITEHTDTEIMTLNKIKPGKKCKVIKVKSGSALKHRLLEMGIHTGSVILVERIAPLGDPIEIKVKAYHLTIRKKDASDIEVDEME